MALVLTLQDKGGAGPILTLAQGTAPMSAGTSYFLLAQIWWRRGCCNSLVNQSGPGNPCHYLALIATMFDTLRIQRQQTEEEKGEQIEKEHDEHI